LCPPRSPPHASLRGVCMHGEQPFGKGQVAPFTPPPPGKRQMQPPPSLRRGTLFRFEWTLPGRAAGSGCSDGSSRRRSCKQPFAATAAVWSPHAWKATLRKRTYRLCRGRGRCFPSLPSSYRRGHSPLSLTLGSNSISFSEGIFHAKHGKPWLVQGNAASVGAKQVGSPLRL